MDIIWNQVRMQELLKDFNTVTQVRVGFFSLEGEELLAYPEEISGFCKLIRKTPKGEAKCGNCDREAFLRATTEKDLYIYKCHAGLTEVIAPIMGSTDEKPIGYLMVGQIRNPGDTPSKSAAAYEDAFNALPLMTANQIAAAAHILQAFTAYVQLEDYVQVQNEQLAVRTAKYIREHLAEDLSIERLSGAMGVGKTSLCGSIKKKFHVSVGELIKEMRIRKAEMLLRTTSIPISEIAEAIGIADYNYFSKVFKARISVAPSRYRKIASDDVNDLQSLS